MWLLIVLLFIVFIFCLAKNQKKIHDGCINMFCGAPKTGKDWLCIWKGVCKYNVVKLKYYIKKYIFMKDIEKPLLYCNIPLTLAHVPVDNDLLLRKKRYRFGSVVILVELSLVADSMCYNDYTINEQLQLLYKLFGHETHGGYLYANTQNPADNHFSVKRNMDRYIFIYRTIKWIPFIGIFKVREMAYSEDNQSAMNVFNEDIEETMKWLVVPKKVWKWYDYCCYSCFTDNLPVADNVLPKDKKRYLKQPYPPSIRKFKTLKIEEKKESEKNENEKD